ncbi:MAG: TlpA family protein disulfide reductase [Saprospiraceae bacterium]|nr:TlpA family protein disulfide reductase [Saprospiraceae bacterium]
MLYATAFSRLLLFITLSLFITSTACTKSPVSGKIEWERADLKKVVYLLSFPTYESLVSPYQGTVLDSAKVDQAGSFAFSKIPGNGFYALAIQSTSEKYNNKLTHEDPNLSNYLPFVYSGKAMVLTANAGQFQKTAQWTHLDEINAQISELIVLRNNAFNQHLAKLEAVNEENLIEQHKAHHEFKKALFDFALATPHVSVALLAMRWATPEGDFERSSDELFGFCKKWENQAASHPMIAQLCSKVKTGGLAAKKGDLFPDFPLPMDDGTEKKVFSLLGSRLTIIDLWASWCGPCRIENKKVLGPIWEKYHDAGLQIIGYALDSDDRSWKNAIAKDAADRWLHASHLLGDESPLFQTLGISTIPANYLLDKEGRILAKNLHGEELTTWIDAYLK